MLASEITWEIDGNDQLSVDLKITALKGIRIERPKFSLVEELRGLLVNQKNIIHEFDLGLQDGFLDEGEYKYSFIKDVKYLESYQGKSVERLYYLALTAEYRSEGGKEGSKNVLSAITGFLSKEKYHDKKYITLDPKNKLYEIVRGYTIKEDKYGDYMPIYAIATLVALFAIIFYTETQHKTFWVGILLLPLLLTFILRDIFFRGIAMSFFDVKTAKDQSIISLILSFGRANPWWLAHSKCTLEIIEEVEDNRGTSSVPRVETIYAAVPQEVEIKGSEQIIQFNIPKDLPYDYYSRDFELKWRFKITHQSRFLFRLVQLVSFRIKKG